MNSAGRSASRASDLTSTGQMNRSSAWFDKHYQGVSVKRFIIHPSHTVQSAAAFTHDVEATREVELRLLVTAVRSFFKSFEGQNFQDLSPNYVQQMINDHHLAVSDFLSKYSRKLRNLR